MAKNRKITKVFTEKPAKPVVLEAGLLSRLINAVKNEPQQPTPQSTASVDKSAEDFHGLLADGESSIQQVLGRIFSVPSDSVRCVLFLKEADLKSLYLRSGGEKLFADSVDEAALVVNSDNVDGQFKSTGTNFDLDDVTDPWSAVRPKVVLLNIKKNVFDTFVKATDAAAKRAALVSCISHKFYVAVLNAEVIKKANVGALTDRDEREDKFNIRTFILAYPLRSVIDSARAEFDKRGSEAKANNSAADEALIDKIVASAISYVFKNAPNGKLNITEEDFEQGLTEVLTKNPELDGKEHLGPIVVEKFLTTKQMADAKYAEVLAFIGPVPEPVLTAGQSNNDAPDFPAKDATDIDMSKFVDWLESNPSQAKQLLSKLKSNPAVGKYINL